MMNGNVIGSILVRSLASGSLPKRSISANLSHKLGDDFLDRTG
jgi:hypothetical protein